MTRRESRITRNTRAMTLAAFEACPSEYAILASDGMILAVNTAWRQFGEQNGAGSRCGPGTNYLSVTQRAAESGDEIAATVAAALDAVFTGNAPSARIDYPCHSPQQQRWFRLHARPLPQRPEILLVHDDITDHIQTTRLAKAQGVQAARAASLDTTS